MKPDEIEKNDEITSRIELEKLLEQKQSETDALKRLIGVLKKKTVQTTEPNPKNDPS